MIILMTAQYCRKFFSLFLQGTFIGVTGTVGTEGNTAHTVDALFPVRCPGGTGKNGSGRAFCRTQAAVGAVFTALRPPGSTSVNLIAAVGAL